MPEFVEWMMGLPLDWTAGVSWTARLKMLGNAVHVQTAEYVGRLIVEMAAGRMSHQSLLTEGAA